MDRAFIFDVFGTLVDWRAGVASAVRETCAAKGVQVDPHAFADHWRGLYAPSMARVRSGARPYVALDVLHRENLDATLAAFGLEERFDETERAALTTAWERLPPWPDVLDGMDRLRPNGLLASCSNGSIALSVRLGRFAGFRWDAILGAEIARSYKPDPDVYRASVAALGLPPKRVVMVAAHNDDLAAARDMGLRTAFIPRPREHGPGQTRDLAAESDWTFVATDLPDLAAQVATG